MIGRLFWICFCVFVVAVSYIAFFEPLQLWDESRSLFNAIESPRSTSWMVTTYNGVADHWYTKPPLYVWVVSALIRARINPMLALRLPSLVAGMLSIVAIYFHASRRLQRPGAGVIAALLLMSSTVFFGPHVALTGDLDAVLSLFLTVCALAFWAYVEQRGSEAGWIAVSCLALLLAVLTKGIAGALFLPGLLAFTLLRPERWRVLSDWKLWSGLLLVTVVVLGYYYERNVLDPGYLHAVFTNEFGRYNVVVESHKGGPAFYLQVLLKGFEPGFLLVLLACFSFRRDVRRNSLSHSTKVLCLVVTGFYLLVLTGSKTKTIWYAAPALPLLSLFAAVGFTDTVNLFWKNAGDKAKKIWIVISQVWIPVVLMGVMFVAVFIRGHHVRAHLQNSDIVAWSNELKVLLTEVPGVDHLVVLDMGVVDYSTGRSDYFPIGRFWALTYAQKHGVAVQIAGSTAEIPRGEWVISCAPKLFETDEFQRRLGSVVDSSSRCVAGQLTK